MFINHQTSLANSSMNIFKIYKNDKNVTKLKIIKQKDEVLKVNF